MGGIGSKKNPLAIFLILLSWPSAILGESDNPQGLVSEFNEVVSRAVSIGETWPCNPVNQAREWFSWSSGESLAMDHFSCKGGPRDSVAVVLVRGTQNQKHNTANWVELRFEQTENRNWHLISVTRKTHEAKWPEIPFSLAGLNEVKNQRGKEPAPQVSGVREYSISVGGMQMVLKSNKLSSIGCGPKESGLPVGRLSTKLPCPYAVPQVGFCVFEKGDVALSLVKMGTGESSTYPFGLVEPSLYMVEFDWSQLGPGGFEVEVWYNSTPTSMKFVRVN